MNHPGKRFVVFILFLFQVLFAKANTIHIIPEPVELLQKSGTFRATGYTHVKIDENAKACTGAIENFLSLLRQEYKQPLNHLKESGTGKKKNHTIRFRINKYIYHPFRPEAYRIDVSVSKIMIEASDAAGMFYAIQTLQQVMRPEGIPAMSVRDYPQYAYRGMHLDVSRHFFPGTFIKKYLDLLARYKINTFHWHLTDSHGWRLEIKQYPKLTSVGAWRAPRENIPMTIALPTQPGEAATYGGFYTQEEVKDIIAYARERFITIIPEIEMPGHCTAALVAYPEYSTQNASVPLLIPGGYSGDLLHNFCAGNDSVFLFLNNILTEVIDLFPSVFIHIGGDEVKAEPWLRCPRCTKRMRDLGLKTTKQLQAYFTERIDSFVTAKGRKSIGWDEILEAGNLSPNAAVMSWRGIAGGIEGAKKGHKVVMAPYRYVYFDFYQSDPSLEPDITYAGLYLDSVYAFDARPAELNASEAANIIGAQACLWTENVKTTDRVEYMLLPRLIAFAESVWTPGPKKNYRNFIEKLEHEFSRLDKESTHYAKSLYNAGFIARFDTTQKNISLVITNQVANKHQVRYTRDGTVPNASSSPYHSPLVIEKSEKITVALFNDKGMMLGKPNSQFFTFHKATCAAVLVESTTRTTKEKRITDGIYGSVEPYDGRWVMLSDSIETIRLDLGAATSIRSLRFRCLEDKVGNAYLPGKISIAVSEDGETFREVYTKRNEQVLLNELRHIKEFSTGDMELKGRFINIVLQRSADLPFSATKPIMFIDEIEVL